MHGCICSHTLECWQGNLHICTCRNGFTQTHTFSFRDMVLQMNTQVQVKSSFFFFCWQERHPSLMVNAYVPFNTISFLSLYCSRRKWGGSDEDYFAIYTLTHTHTNMHAHTHKHTVKISTPALILSEKHFCCSFLKYYHGVRFSVWV